MFTIRAYQSDETYDLAKFMNFVDDVYDVCGNVSVFDIINTIRLVKGIKI